eukprot:3978045-Pyramimonas_sp.AAC.1
MSQVYMVSQLPLGTMRPLQRNHSMWTNHLRQPRTFDLSSGWEAMKKSAGVPGDEGGTTEERNDRSSCHGCNILLNMPPYLLRRVKDTVEPRQKGALINILRSNHRRVAKKLGR